MFARANSGHLEARPPQKKNPEKLPGALFKSKMCPPLALVQRSNTEPEQLRCFIFYQLGCSDRLAYGAFGSGAMILKPVTSQNVDDRSAKRDLPIRVVAIVEHHVFFACQHIKYDIDALAVFVHGDDEWYMAFEPSIVAHMPRLSRPGDRLVAVRADLVWLPSHFS
jgi:hypothetical protein